MTTPTNIPTENYTEITNKKFLWLNDMFNKYGWHIVKNDLNNISYTKSHDETSYFDIAIHPDYTKVSFPVKNSTYQYSTTFTDKANNEMITYVCDKLFDYNK